MKKICFRAITAMTAIISLTLGAYAVPDSLIPVGRTVGIHLCGELVVVGFDSEIGAGAQAAGVQVGDRIISVNGTLPTSLDSIRMAAGAPDGVHLTVERKGKNVEFFLSPTLTPEGKRLGLKIRDGITGIGTVTFYNPSTGEFGALGHSVNDPETGQCLGISGGSIMAASVSDVVRGRSGMPGALKGSFDVGNEIGSVRENNSCGIFGTIQLDMDGSELLPLARGDEVQASQAEILSNVEGTQVRPYRVRITKVSPEDRSGRNFQFEVCDETLLRRTGGIVQGMSGSPVIQNGRIIGAVTHVLVDDPRMGYGIFIENMLDAEDAA